MTITYREATIADNFTAFTIFLKSIMDYEERAGVMAITGGNDPEKMKTLWESRRPIWDHLADSGDRFWLAESEAGEALGYARSIRRGEHRELTEFFVLPGRQAMGIGRELIRRAFPHDTPFRSVVATTDPRALARYLKAGVYPYLTEMYFERAPEIVEAETDLTIEAVQDARGAPERLGDIDREVLGYARQEEHAFLGKERSLYLYQRGGRMAGYGYLQKDYYGPFALLDARDFPAVLAHAETQACKAGAERVGFEVPSTNIQALDYLMKRSYQIAGFMGSIMSNRPFGRLENYILMSPPFFL